MAPFVLAPHETFAGYQDEANHAFVAGWAWDARYPDTPVRVSVYDGESLVATATADLFRADLRDAGVGNGRHGFLVRFPAPIQDHTRHHITVRITDAAVLLRDTRTNGIPRPITRRTAPVSPPIPDFSLSRVARWWYFTVIKTLCRPFPQPVWRFTALLFGLLMALGDARGRRLDVALLTALNLPYTRAVRWRLHWRRCTLQQADLLLLLQTERFTAQWIRQVVHLGGEVPAGGAILVTPHHCGEYLSCLALSLAVANFGVISAEPEESAQDFRTDPTLRFHWRQLRIARTRSFRGQYLSRREAARSGLRLLRQGGSLVVFADDFTSAAVPQPLLGRVMPLPRGAAWFAQQSGKPIVPFMLVPSGRGWRLWMGAPVAATEAGVQQGLEACIRQSPGGWMRFVAMQWLAAPVWETE